MAVLSRPLLERSRVCPVCEREYRAAHAQHSYCSRRCSGEATREPRVFASMEQRAMILSLIPANPPVSFGEIHRRVEGYWGSYGVRRLHRQVGVLVQQGRVVVDGKARSPHRRYRRAEWLA